MRRPAMLTALLLLAAAAVPSAPAADKTVFGPAKYEVADRYGKANRYTASFRASEALYLVLIENGEKPGERPDFIEFSLNGVHMLRNDQYLYRYLACFAKLRADNSFELVLRDRIPEGFRRPAPTPKNAVVSAVTVQANMAVLNGVFGAQSREGLQEVVDALVKIKSPEARQYAMKSASLQNDLSTRLDAARKLTDLKERSAQDHLRKTLRDMAADSDVRAEAAFALGMIGDRADIPLLMRGVVDSDEKIAAGAARGLSFYPEADTQEPLITTLEQMDNMRKGPVIRNIASAGWKPVGAMTTMADSKDPYIASTALHLLGSMNDARATDYLLQLLDQPGGKDVRVVISALGMTRDPRAAERLLAIATDPARRAGNEAELCEALANLGEQRAVKPIEDMMRNVQYGTAWRRMNTAYKQLTGKDFGK